MAYSDYGSIRNHKLDKVHCLLPLIEGLNFTFPLKLTQ